MRGGALRAQADVWPRLGRQVLDAELGAPAKEVRKRGSGKNEGQGEAATPEEVAEVRPT
jgi:hypothetical protein